MMEKETGSADFFNNRTVAIHHKAMGDCKVNCCGYDTKADQYHPINHRVLFVEFRIEKEIVGIQGNQQAQKQQADAIVNVRFSYIPALLIGIPYAEGDLVKYK